MTVIKFEQPDEVPPGYEYVDLRVGQLFMKGVTSWGADPVAHLRITPHVAEIVVALPRITAREVTDITARPSKYGWVDAEHGGLLVCRFGDMWFDCAFTPHREPDYGWPKGQGHAPVLICAVDAATGILAGMKFQTWSPRFTQTVQKTCDRLLAQPWNEQLHEQCMTALFNRYPHSKVLMRQRADITCTGGSLSDSSAPGTGPHAYPPPRKRR